VKSHFKPLKTKRKEISGQNPASASGVEKNMIDIIK